MRRIAVLAVALVAVTTMAQAQEATPPAIPPSACAGFVAAPTPPDGATANATQMRDAVAAYEAWRASTQQTLDCRRAEAELLGRQAQERASEYRAAQADNIARAATWQAQIDAYQARQSGGRSNR